MMYTERNSMQCNNTKDRLKALSFSVLETALYLDGHPNCKQALEHYDATVEELERATEEYEDKYGPLTIYSNAHDTWEWVSSPWPWESEAN